MPKITYIDFEGTKRDVEATVGESLMEAAISNDIPGIDADCGGACACATCHIYINEGWADKVKAAEELETEMLSVVEEQKDSSRLSCQVQVTEEMNGLIVSTPESQY